MKKFLLVAVSLMLAQVSMAAPAAKEKEVAIGISGVFVPGGFDSSSDAYVVVNGVFPNGCYKWSRAQRTDISNFKHEIRSIASVTQGMCIMVLIPFQKEVRLGQLATGQHTLKFVNDDGTYVEKTLAVE
jgi:hypothetical protein